MHDFHVAEQQQIEHPSMKEGLWVLAGLLVFIVLEKIFTSAAGNVDFQKAMSDLTAKQENIYVVNNNIKELVSGYATGNCTKLQASDTHEKKSLLAPVKSASKKVCSLSFMSCRYSGILGRVIHIC